MGDEVGDMPTEEPNTPRVASVRVLNAMHDWTIDPSTGKSNSSEKFVSLVDEVARIIKQSAHALIAGESQSVARTIMAQLAHVHGLVPALMVISPDDHHAVKGIIVWNGQELEFRAPNLVTA